MSKRNSNTKFQDGKQCQRILEHLQNGGTITRLEANQKHWDFILELPARIKELREAGHNIISEYFRSPVHNNKRIARYRLAMPVQPELFGGTTTNNDRGVYNG